MIVAFHGRAKLRLRSQPCALKLAVQMPGLPKRRRKSDLLASNKKQQKLAVKAPARPGDKLSPAIFSVPARIGTQVQIERSSSLELE